MTTSTALVPVHRGRIATTTAPPVFPRRGVLRFLGGWRRAERAFDRMAADLVAEQTMRLAAEAQRDALAARISGFRLDAAEHVERALAVKEQWRQTAVEAQKRVSYLESEEGYYGRHSHTVPTSTHVGHVLLDEAIRKLKDAAETYELHPTDFLRALEAAGQLLDAIARSLPVDGLSWDAIDLDPDADGWDFHDLYFFGIGAFHETARAWRELQSLLAPLVYDDIAQKTSSYSGQWSAHQMLSGRDTGPYDAGKWASTIITALDAVGDVHAMARQHGTSRPEEEAATREAFKVIRTLSTGIIGLATPRPPVEREPGELFEHSRAYRLSKQPELAARHDIDRIPDCEETVFWPYRHGHYRGANTSWVTRCDNGRYLVAPIVWTGATDSTGCLTDHVQVAIEFDTLHPALIMAAYELAPGPEGLLMTEHLPANCGAGDCPSTSRTLHQSEITWPWPLDRPLSEVFGDDKPDRDPRDDEIPF